MQTNIDPNMNVVPINCQMDDLLDEYAQNKIEADKLTARSQELARQIASLASYRHGSKTGHVTGHMHKATVTIRENVKFDQSLLEEARTAVGNERFFELFQPKFEPRGGLAILKKKLPTMAEIDRARIERAMTVAPGQPQVKIEDVQ